MKPKPAKVTLGQVSGKLADIRILVVDGDKKAAETEEYQLFVDVLHTIANAPTMSDKRELKRLAQAALSVQGIWEMYEGQDPGSAG